MIVSASRRTDIPAFYMPWMVRRLERASVRAVNPFNPHQQRVVSLAPDDVDALVFWTRDPGRLADAVPALRALGHERVVALVTITGLGRPLEPFSPSRARAVRGFHALAERFGDQDRVRWRYDPIVLDREHDAAFHRAHFAALARELLGATRVVIVSFLDIYRKTARRLRALGARDPQIVADAASEPEAHALVRDLSSIAAAHGMAMQTCAEPVSFADDGAPAGRCIDPLWLGALFPDRVFAATKDRGQREHCGCAPAIDIGMTDTCLHGCEYCYATRSHDAALARHARHDPEADALVPVPEPRGSR